MEHCKMITFQELQAMQEQGDSFRPIPVWLERNPRYNGTHLQTCEAAVLEMIDDDISDEEIATVFLQNGTNLNYFAYGKSWRLWYACGAEMPTCDEPWEMFSWDKERGE